MNIRIMPYLQICKYAIKQTPFDTSFYVCTMLLHETACLRLQNSLYWTPKRPVFGGQNGTFSNVLETKRLTKAVFAATINIKMLTAAWPIGNTRRIGRLRIFYILKVGVQRQGDYPYSHYRSILMALTSIGFSFLAPSSLHHSLYKVHAIFP